ncbi:5'-nucleotidase, C-terminal domain [Pustulibacterium marinum]|uniref:5'-nucleotidase, C-terminal domain n=1 Tax=Pustulibacterium marinum TaxID=1224947 RepID=A0A1I7IKB2_9FLAO|nr:5'-nucleotidase [Pustulibacterium marinum]SFU73370.1 5'-nucleotidase, C-terminal domain [Pustulibacterium marinum]
MKIKHFVIFITLSCFFSCTEQPKGLKTIKGKQININNEVSISKEIDSFITPFKLQIAADSVLNASLSYAPKVILKESDKMNSPLGNLLADIIYEQSDSVFYSETGKHVDFALLNYGGIRANIPIGNITKKLVYKIMPFENKIIIAELPSEAITELLAYLIEKKRGHPVSKQIQLILDKNRKLKKFTINGQKTSPNKTYFVATYDFLYNGGDAMNFFKKSVNTYQTNYLARDAMTDYFMKKDTIISNTDDRFIIK